MNKKYLTVLLFLLSSFGILCAQIVINEGSNKNFTQIADEDNEYEDWIEIYNASDSTVNIADWTLTDNINIPNKWVFPNINLAAGNTLLIFASGKDRREYSNAIIWESPVLPSDNFKYLVPTSSVANWNTLSFNASGWNTGSAGFGYEDGDDVTILPDGTLVVYVRKTFSISDLSVITDAICHVDYDDGFVAYINGVEICRGNITGTPAWNSNADGNHEAQGTPDAFELDMDVIRPLLIQGENVFAIEAHNVNNTSSDLSLIPYLSFEISGGAGYFNAAPAWLTNSGSKNLHSNFKISSEDETIYLFNSQNTLVSFLDVSNLLLNHSIGCATDGAAELAVFTTSTPGKSNNTSQAYTKGYTARPLFDLEPGFYTGSQSLRIYGSSATIDVRYTTDGSTPTSSSTLYTGAAIQMSKTTTVNARCFSKGDELPGKARTATYFIDEDFTIPVLSVTTDNENLFGSTGIFTNYSEEWNKPCYIEYFDENKSMVISQAAGIQVDGGAGGSRSKPQTSFRIEPGNGTFGDGAVNYNFHPERPNRNNYESLYLRNGSNQYLTYFCKDATQVRGMGKNTNNFYSEYRPIIVFINGGYYGMYEGREKINADYLESNYAMDTDSLNMVGISHFNQPRTILPIVGTTDQFLADYERFKVMNPNSVNYLEEVGKFLDLENYTDYMAGQTWMTNKDWPHNNMKAWRCKGSDMRWQFALVDLEWSFLPTKTSANLATRPTFDQINYMNGLTTQWPASGYWYMLMQNDDYKHHFINRLCDLMNTSYDYEVLYEIETDIFKEAVPEIAANYLRWNGGDSYDFYSNYYDFGNELSTREAYLRQHLKNNYSLTKDVEITLAVKPAGAGRIKISTIVPDAYPWKGDYFSDVPITIEAIPGPGYTFASWDNNKHIANTSLAKFTSEISDLSTTFTANFVAGESNFNGITISEINYKNGDGLESTDWFEIWNATDESLALNGWYFTDKNPDHIFTFGAALSIPAGERLVVARDPIYFKSLYPDVKNVAGGFDFGFAKITDEINLFNGDDVLVVQAKYSDLFPWALRENNDGKTLELLNPEASLMDPYNWFAGCYKGSPGTGFDPDCGGNTGLEDKLTGGVALKAYPNPVQNKLTLEFYVNNGQANTHVSIYNVMGSIVYSDSYTGLSTGLNLVDINVSELKSGQMYFVSVTSNGVQQTIKLIKE